MPSQGPNLPDSGANNTGAGQTAWVAASSITGDDGFEASATLSGSNTSNYLVGTDFDFTIPIGATIDGILVEWKRRSTLTTAEVKDVEVRLWVDGAASGNDKADTVNPWPAPTLTLISYGGATDTWGLTLTPEQVNATTFGAAIRAQRVDTIGNARVGHVQITIFYTEGASSFKAWRTRGANTIVGAAA